MVIADAKFCAPAGHWVVQANTLVHKVSSVVQQKQQHAASGLTDSSFRSRTPEFVVPMAAFSFAAVSSTDALQPACVQPPGLQV